MFRVTGLPRFQHIAVEEFKGVEHGCALLAPDAAGDPAEGFLRRLIAVLAGHDDAEHGIFRAPIGEVRGE